jgi:hypothetical protein
MEESYFSEIPEWSVELPRFIIQADMVSGRIPVTRLESWKSFAELLESDFFDRHGVQFIYRGHRRHDWSLLPTLGRVTENGIVSDELANQQMNKFRLAVRGRLPDNSLLDGATADADDELWAVGQHYGLMTPLLDWTHSPFVALFFAFAKEDLQGEEDNPYRAIYVLNKSFVSDPVQCPDIQLLEPRKDDHGRLVSQAGLFTYSPTDSTIENKLIEIISKFEEFQVADEGTEADVLANYICKIYVRNDDREGCLKYLRRMNVHHASLFPDLLGASDYCNILIEEEQRSRAIAEAEKAASSVKDKPEPANELVVAVEHGAELAGGESTTSLVVLLSTPEESKQVEPGRIQLMAERLNAELKKHKVVDWDKRESALAKLRTVARVTLRNLGYPHAARDRVIEQVIEFAKAKESEE